MIIINTQKKEFSEIIPTYRDFDYSGSVYIRSDEISRYTPVYISFKPQPGYIRKRLYIKKGRRKLKSLILACCDYNNVNIFFIDKFKERPAQCIGIWMKLNENLEYIQNEPR